MFPSRDAYDTDNCPIDDELLGQLYRANGSGLPELVESVSSDARTMLALFCYRRAHMHSLALAIASSCTERELVRIGGRVGAALYAQSRQTPAQHASTSFGRKPITLSTKPLSVLRPLDNTLDDETPEAAIA